MSLLDLFELTEAAYQQLLHHGISPDLAPQIAISLYLTPDGSPCMDVLLPKGSLPPSRDAAAE